MNNFFRQEADRIKELNKYKEPDDYNFLVKGVLLFFGILFGFVIVIPLMLYFIWASSFVGVHLWAWFVMPLFNVPVITKLQMAGIFTFISLIKMGLAPTPTEKNKAATIIGLSIAPWVILLTGYVIHRMM